MNRQPLPRGSKHSGNEPASIKLKAIRTAVRLFRIAPLPIRRALIGDLLAQALRQSLAEGNLDPMKDRVVLIDISDVGIRWPLSVIDDQLVLLRKMPKADVTIRGRLWEFMLLATRRCDPDTLFFDRRLSIEGDTELGLAVKNALDALDDSQLPTSLRYGMRVGSKLVDQIL
jgi:predicted lipid carrier protein YhbT